MEGEMGILGPTAPLKAFYHVIFRMGAVGLW